jgi:hypothetical protein
MPTAQNINTEPLVSDCPVQDELYGDTNFFSSEDFSCRYIVTKKLFFKSIYIPYGPRLKTANSINHFLDWINSFKLTKVKIDLYRIGRAEDLKLTLGLLGENGFKKAKYIQDPQTSIVKKDDYRPSSRARRYIKSAEKHHLFKVLEPEDITDEIIDECYSIYKTSCESKGYKLSRSKGYFKQLASDGLLALAQDKGDMRINCFLICSKGVVASDSGPKRILYLVFTAMSDKGRDLHLGYGVTASVFDYVFSNDISDEADFLGFSAEFGKHSLFKTKFGNTIVDLPGSYERFKLL